MKQNPCSKCVRIPQTGSKWPPDLQRGAVVCCIALMCASFSITGLWRRGVGNLWQLPHTVCMTNEIKSRFHPFIREGVVLIHFRDSTLLHICFVQGSDFDYADKWNQNRSNQNTDVLFSLLCLLSWSDLCVGQLCTAHPCPSLWTDHTVQVCTDSPLNALHLHAQPMEERMAAERKRNQVKTVWK